MRSDVAAAIEKLFEVFSKADAQLEMSASVDTVAGQAIKSQDQDFLIKNTNPVLEDLGFWEENLRGVDDFNRDYWVSNGHCAVACRGSAIRGCVQQAGLVVLGCAWLDRVHLCLCVRISVDNSATCGHLGGYGMGPAKGRGRTEATKQA